MTTDELYEDQEETTQEHAWEESCEDSDVALMTVDPDLIEMWKTTCSFSEQTLTESITDAQRKRWAYLKSRFEANPREYYVAECESCEWFMGGWLSSAKAAKVLANHMKRAH